MRRRLSVLLLGLGLAFGAQAQDFPREEIDLDLFIQQLFQVQDEDTNYEDLYEALFQFYRNPLNLNTATKEELGSLFVLSETQVNNLFDHIQRNGKLLSIYELQSIPGFDMVTIYRLVPFAVVRDQDMHSDRRSIFARMAEEDNNNLLLRYSRILEQKKGFTEPGIGRNGLPETRYLGSPDKLYARYRLAHSKDFSFGFTAEKDAGEQLTWDPGTKRYGMDFWSAHFQLYNKGPFKAIALGDYQLQIGQGLLLSSGFKVGKGAETINTLRRSQLGIRPFTSVLETQFFRGGAATYSFKRVDVTGFYSRKGTDGTLQVDSLALSLDPDLPPVDFAEPFFSSVSVDGFHRTPNEIAQKGAVREQVGGGDITYSSADQNFKMGLTAVRTHYSAPLIRDQRIYNRYEFQGSSNTNFGTHYSYNWRNFNFFGETGRSESGGIGTVNGFMASLSTRVDFAMVYRNYARDFHSFYGRAFGESIRNINERGMYWGLKVRPHSQVELAAYYDRFSSPWLRYLVDAPSQGSEYLARLTYRPTKKITMYGQLRTEHKERNVPDNTTPVDYTSPTLRRSYLLNVDYAAPTVLSLRSRLQFSTYEQQESNPQTKGYLIWQDVNLDFGRWRLSTRYAIFDTDDYYTRQYAFERDVLYAFSIPVLSGQGTRVYGLVQFRVNRHITLWAKYAVTNYRNINTVGSGLEEVNKPRRSEVRVQMRYKF